MLLQSGKAAGSGRGIWRDGLKDGFRTAPSDPLRDRFSSAAPAVAMARWGDLGQGELENLINAVCPGFPVFARWILQVDRASGPERGEAAGPGSQHLDPARPDPEALLPSSAWRNTLQVRVLACVVQIQ